MSDDRYFWFHVAIKQAGISWSEYGVLASRFPALLHETQRIERDLDGQEKAWAYMSAILWAQELAKPR